MTFRVDFTTGTSFSEGGEYRFTITPDAAVSEATTIRWEIVPLGALPISLARLSSTDGTLNFVMGDTAGKSVSFTATANDVINYQGSFEIRVYKVVDGMDDELVGSSETIVLENDVAIDPATLFPIDGSIAPNFFSVATSRGVELNGAGGNDVYIINKYHSGFAKISDTFGVNQVVFDSGVIITAITEVLDSRDSIYAVKLILSTGGVVEVELPSGDDWQYRLGAGEALSYADFKSIVGAGYVVESRYVGDAPDAPSTIDLSVRGSENGDILSPDITGITNYTNSGGDDIYIITRQQYGNVNIEDTLGSNIIKFDAGIEITSFTPNPNSIADVAITLATGAVITITNPNTSAYKYQLGDDVLLDYAAFATEIGTAPPAMPYIISNEDPPTLTAQGQGSVAENGAGGESTSITFTSTDATDSAITYIVSDIRFEVDTTTTATHTLRVKEGIVLDAEEDLTSNEISLTVTARSANGYSAPVSVTIAVTSVEDNNPTIMAGGTQGNITANATLAGDTLFSYASFNLGGVIFEAAGEAGNDIRVSLGTSMDMSELPVVVTESDDALFAIILKEGGAATRKEIIDAVNARLDITSAISVRLEEAGTGDTEAAAQSSTGLTDDNQLFALTGGAGFLIATGHTFTITDIDVGAENYTFTITVNDAVDNRFFVQRIGATDTYQLMVGSATTFAENVDVLITATNALDTTTDGQNPIQVVITNFAIVVGGAIAPVLTITDDIQGAALTAHSTIGVAATANMAERPTDTGFRFTITDADIGLENYDFIFTTDGGRTESEDFSAIRNGATDEFLILIKGGIQFNNVGRLTLGITAIDEADNQQVPLSASFTLVVGGTNSVPTLEAQVPGAVGEITETAEGTTASSTRISTGLTFRVADRNTNDTLTVTTNNADFEAIEGTNNIWTIYLKADVAYDAETTSSIEFSIIASDGAANTEPLPVTVNVLNLYDIDPIINNFGSQDITISANTSVMAAVGENGTATGYSFTLQETDEAADGMYTFTYLINGTETETHFTEVLKQGTTNEYLLLVSDNAVFDMEGDINVTVNVATGGRDVPGNDFAFTIRDQNEDPTITANMDTDTLSDAATAGTATDTGTGITFTIDDPNAGDVANLSVTSENSNFVVEKDTNDDGDVVWVLRVAESPNFNFDAEPTLTFDVLVRDDRGGEARQSITINLTDANAAPPLITDITPPGIDPIALGAVLGMADTHATGALGSLHITERTFNTLTEGYTINIVYDMDAPSNFAFEEDSEARTITISGSRDSFASSVLQQIINDHTEYGARFEASIVGVNTSIILVDSVTGIPLAHTIDIAPTVIAADYDTGQRFTLHDTDASGLQGTPAEINITSSREDLYKVVLDDTVPADEDLYTYKILIIGGQSLQNSADATFDVTVTDTEGLVRSETFELPLETVLEPTLSVDGAVNAPNEGRVAENSVEGTSTGITLTSVYLGEDDIEYIVSDTRFEVVPIDGTLTLQVRQGADLNAESSALIEGALNLTIFARTANGDSPEVDVKIFITNIEDNAPTLSRGAGVQLPLTADTTSGDPFSHASINLNGIIIETVGALAGAASNGKLIAVGFNADNTVSVSEGNPETDLFKIFTNNSGNATGKEIIEALNARLDITSGISARLTNAGESDVQSGIFVAAVSTAPSGFLSFAGGTGSLTPTGHTFTITDLDVGEESYLFTITVNDAVDDRFFVQRIGATDTYQLMVGSGSEFTDDDRDNDIEVSISAHNALDIRQVVNTSFTLEISEFMPNNPMISKTDTSRDGLITSEQEIGIVQVDADAEVSGVIFKAMAGGAVGNDITVGVVALSNVAAGYLELVDDTNGNSVSGADFTILLAQNSTVTRSDIVAYITNAAPDSFLNITTAELAIPDTGDTIFAPFADVDVTENYTNNAGTAHGFTFADGVDRVALDTGLKFRLSDADPGIEEYDIIITNRQGLANGVEGVEDSRIGVEKISATNIATEYRIIITPGAVFTETEKGNLRIAVTAIEKNSGGLQSATTSFTLRIDEPNTDPILSAQGDTEVAETTSLDMDTLTGITFATTDDTPNGLGGVHDITYTVENDPRFAVVRDTDNGDVPTLQIRAGTALDAEAEAIEVIVVATDEAGGKDTISVFVRPTDIDDNAPEPGGADGMQNLIITAGEAVLGAEDGATTATGYTFTLTDADVDSRAFDFVVELGNGDDLTAFDVERIGDTDVYSLVVKHNQTFDTAGDIRAFISAKNSRDIIDIDADGFIITVRATNEAPSIEASATAITISEDTTAATSITFTITDTNAGDLDTIEVTTENDNFTAVRTGTSNVWVLHVAADANLSYESNSTFEFDVIATDDRGGVDRERITITLADAPDAPSVALLPEALHDPLTLGAVLGTLGTDFDTGLRFTLDDDDGTVSGTPAVLLGRMAINKSDIYKVELVDPAATTSYAYKVLIVGGTTLQSTADATFILTITDTQNLVRMHTFTLEADVPAPIFTTGDASAQVLEDATADLPITHSITTNYLGDDALTYTISDSRFIVETDPSTGNPIIKVAASGVLDADIPSEAEIRLTITAHSANGDIPHEFTVTIGNVDDNDAIITQGGAQGSATAGEIVGASAASPYASIILGGIKFTATEAGAMGDGTLIFRVTEEAITQFSSGGNYTIDIPIGSTLSDVISGLESFIRAKSLQAELAIPGTEDDIFDIAALTDETYMVSRQRVDGDESYGDDEFFFTGHTFTVADADVGEETYEFTTTDIHGNADERFFVIPVENTTDEFEIWIREGTSLSDNIVVRVSEVNNPATFSDFTIVVGETTAEPTVVINTPQNIIIIDDIFEVDVPAVRATVEYAGLRFTATEAGVAGNDIIVRFLNFNRESAEASTNTFQTVQFAATSTLAGVRDLINNNSNFFTAELIDPTTGGANFATVSQIPSTLAVTVDFSGGADAHIGGAETYASAVTKGIKFTAIEAGEAGNGKSVVIAVVTSNTPQNDGDSNSVHAVFRLSGMGATISLQDIINSLQDTNSAHGMLLSDAGIRAELAEPGTDSTLIIAGTSIGATLFGGYDALYFETGYTFSVLDADFGDEAYTFAITTSIRGEEKAADPRFIVEAIEGKTNEYRLMVLGGTVFTTTDAIDILVVATNEDDPSQTTMMNFIIAPSLPNHTPLLVINNDHQEASIAEDAAEGTSLGITFSVTDPDIDMGEDDIITFTTSDSNFAVEQRDGIWTLVVAQGAVLDADTMQYTRIAVTANDGVGGTATRNVGITLTNVEDENPSITIISDTQEMLPTIGFPTPATEEAQQSSVRVNGIILTLKTNGKSAPITFVWVENEAAEITLIGTTGFRIPVTASTTLNDIVALAEDLFHGALLKAELADPTTGETIFAATAADVDALSGATNYLAAEGTSIAIARGAIGAHTDTGYLFRVEDADLGEEEYTFTFTINGAEYLDGERFSVQRIGLTNEYRLVILEGEVFTESVEVVVIADNGKSVSSEAFIINVQENIDPTLTFVDSISTATLDENLASGAETGISFTATDADDADIASLKLTSSNPNFVLEKSADSNGDPIWKLVVAPFAILDYEDAEMINVIVTAADGRGGTAEQTATITLNNITPEAPTLVTDVTTALREFTIGTIIEPQGSGTGLILRLVAEDGTPLTDGIQIVAAGGDILPATKIAITLSAGYDFEAVFGDVKYAVIFSNGTEVTAAPLSITITDVESGLTRTQMFELLTVAAPLTPDPLTLTAEGTANLSEAARAGEDIGITLTAADPGGAPITFSSNHPYFEVRAGNNGTATLHLAAGVVFDYDAEPPTIPVTITASSVNGATSQQIIVTITDADDQLPVITVSGAQSDIILEGDTITSDIQDAVGIATGYTFTLTDADATASENYTISVADFRFHDRFFVEETGTAGEYRLMVKVGALFDEAGDINVRVSADNGQTTATDFTISVRFPNLAPTLSVSDIRIVPVDADDGFVVATLTPDDINDTAPTLEITSDSSNFGLVDNEDGTWSLVVVSAASLDLTTVSIETITIIARDAEDTELTSESIDVSVSIADANDPSFGGPLSAQSAVHPMAGITVIDDSPHASTILNGIKFTAREGGATGNDIVIGHLGVNANQDDIETIQIGGDPNFIVGTTFTIVTNEQTIDFVIKAITDHESVNVTAELSTATSLTLEDTFPSPTHGGLAQLSGGVDKPNFATGITFTLNDDDPGEETYTFAVLIDGTPEEEAVKRFDVERVGNTNEYEIVVLSGTVFTTAETITDITVLATDNVGGRSVITESFTFTIAPADESRMDARATGPISITHEESTSNNIPNVGELLTVSHDFTDPDGEITDVVYQWQRDGVDIDGAESTTYRPDVAGAYRVIATTTDELNGMTDIPSLALDVI